MIRVGFLVVSNLQNWTGGINYYRNLLDALYSMSDRKIDPVILTGGRGDLTLFKDYPPVDIIRSVYLDRYTPSWWLRVIWRNLFSYDFFLERLLIHNNISILSHDGFLGTKAKIYTIGWIPDFQHRRLPEFFNKKVRLARDKTYRKMCRFCNCVLVSSVEAQKDLQSFEPTYTYKSKVLHFVVKVPDDLEHVALAELEKRYEFSGPYFLLPNQFWAHKNHQIVIEALHILKELNRNILILATGNTYDYRHPDYFDSLMSRARDYGVLDCFKVPGMIPYSDLIALMRHSVAVINPSFFEGWSTTVEEAKTLGKRIILSDIPVHREQAPEGGLYVSPKNPQDLADAMWELWSCRDAVEDHKLTMQAKASFATRWHKFSKTYESIVISVINEQKIST